MVGTLKIIFNNTRIGTPYYTLLYVIYIKYLYIIKLMYNKYIVKCIHKNTI